MVGIGLSLIILINLIIIYKYNEKKNGEKMSVNTIFTLSLSISLLFSVLNVINFVDINYFVFIILLINIVSFYYGGYFSKFVIKRKKKTMKINTDIDLFIKITGIIGFVGVIILTAIFVGNFDFATIFTNPALLAKNFQTTPLIGYFNTLNIIVLPTIIYRYYLYGRIKKEHVLFIISSISGLILAGNKTYIIFCLLSCFAIFTIVYKNNSKLIRIVIFLVIIVIAFFVWYEQTIDIGVYNEANPWWYSPYNYMAGPWVALGELIRNNPSNDILSGTSLFGNYTFYFFYKILEPFVDIDLGSYIMKGINIPQWFNVYTFNGEIYSDFGLIGIIIFSFILGFVSNKLRIIVKNGGNYLDILLYSMIVSGLILCFFVNTFIQSYFIVNYIFIYIYKVVSKEKIIFKQVIK